MYSESKIVVRYAETDKMGIVHHSVYPIWYELGRTDFIKLANLSYTEMEKMGIMLPLVSLTCNYKKPADYEDELTVRTMINKLTPARIEFYYEVYKNEELINTGTTVHAWVGKDLKPINLKKKYNSLYAKIEDLLNT